MQQNICSDENEMTVCMGYMYRAHDGHSVIKTSSSVLCWCVSNMTYYVHCAMCACVHKLLPRQIAAKKGRCRSHNAKTNYKLRKATGTGASKAAYHFCEAVLLCGLLSHWVRGFCFLPSS